MHASYIHKVLELTNSPYSSVPFPVLQCSSRVRGHKFGHIKSHLLKSFSHHISYSSRSLYTVTLNFEKRHGNYRPFVTAKNRRICAQKWFVVRRPTHCIWDVRICSMGCMYHMRRCLWSVCMTYVRSFAGVPPKNAFGKLDGLRQIQRTMITQKYMESIAKNNIFVDIGILAVYGVIHSFLLYFAWAHIAVFVVD